MLGLDEQLGERRVRDVGGLGRQNQFGVGSHLDLARLVAEVRDRHAAHFRIVFGGNQHLQGGRQRPVPTRELGAILVEGDLVSLGLGSNRLVGRRPDLAARDVPQEDVRAPVVAGGVLSPAGHRQVAPGAVAGPGGGKHHGVAAVRQQLRGRRGAPRAGLSPSAGSFDLADPGRRHRLRDRRRGRRDLAWHALLQKQLRRLNDRLGVEAVSHHAVQQGVGDRGDRHALVVGHEGAHNGDALAVRDPGPREVQRLVETVTAAGADGLEALEVPHGGLRVDHACQGGGVGSDYGVVRQPALQAEPGNRRSWSIDR